MKDNVFMNLQSHKRIIISGGGTGGHIFPALSIANALRKADPRIEILFVGAEGRMEMEKVPAAGYRIVGLPVAGFSRKNMFKNIAVLCRLFKSLRIASGIIREFKPDIVVGVGGYASGPVLRQAGRMGIPTVIQEQNSYAGVTNKLLAKRASVICVAYDGMEKYFPAGKIIKTGNPVRNNFDKLDSLRSEALSYFNLDNSRPVVVVLGGSLGAGSINNNLSQKIDIMAASNCQWLWQTGKYYFDDVRKMIPAKESGNIKIHGFIDRMDYAYAAADVIVSRAGAGTISELCLAGKPAILVPSPNVAEDHQTKNARALAVREAAMLIPDSQAGNILVDETIRLVADLKRRETYSLNIKMMADRDADIKIATEILKLVKK